MRFRISRFLLVLILILAIFLRFYRVPELNTFLGDQAIELSSTAQILKGNPTLIGIKTSVSEVRNGAVMYYVMAPFLYLFNLDPLGGSFVQGFFSVFSIIAVYFVARKKKSKKIALLSCFLLAVSSLLVNFSRQTMLAFYPLFFCSLSLFLANKLKNRFSKKASFLLGILLGFMLQVHYSTVAVILFAAFLPWFFINKRNWKKYYSLLLFGFLVGLSPMILFELRHQFFNTKMLFAFLTQSKGVFTSSGFNIFYYWIDAVSQLLFGQSALLASFFILAFFYSLWKYKKSISKLDKLCLLQLVSTIVFTVVFVREMVPHYAITSFIPIVILTSSLFVKAARDNFPNYSFTTSSAFLSFFLLVNLNCYGLTNNHGWTMTKGWNTVGVKKAAKLIARDIKLINPKNGYNVAMLVDAQNQGLPLRYFLENWENIIPPLGFNAYDKAEVLYVVIEPKTDLNEVKIYEITSFGAFDINKKWPIQNGFTLFRLTKKQV